MGTCFERRDHPCDWPELRREVLRRDRHRCRSCGKRGDGETLEALPVRPGDYRFKAVVTLCASCVILFDQLRRNERITALFILRRRGGTRYYAAISDPVSS